MSSNQKLMKLGALIFLMAMTQALAACGTKSDDSSSLLGTAVMGNINGATCSAYQLNADGSRGSLIGSSPTDANGQYSIPASGAGAVSVVCTGGSYVDEASGTTVSLRSTDEIVAMIPDISQQNFANVNALSTIAAGVVAKNASQGLATAIANANLDIAAQFGLTGVDIVGARPVDFTQPISGVSAGSSEAKLGLAMAAFTQVAKDNALTPTQVLDLVKNMAEDYKDGVMDGSNSGAALPVSLSLTPASAISGFATARTNFLNSPRNASGFPASSF